MADFLSYINAQGLVDGVALSDLAAQFGTPLYVYSAEAIRARYRSYHAHGLHDEVVVHYAVKANSNLAILRLLAAEGAGFDIVSVGELERVLCAGGMPESTVFSGVAKTDAELQRALDVGIGCFNVESPEELQRLAALAAASGKVAPFALRVNPNVDAQTHPYISTGMRQNKFGVTMEVAPQLYRWAATQPSLRIMGIGCHIGSQILTLAPFLEAADSIFSLADTLLSEGITIEHIDMGGGLAVATAETPKAPEPAALVQALLQKLAGRPYQLHLQPGRSLVGNAGILLTQVVFVKEQAERQFLMLDAAMNDYIRPALYQVRPTMLNLNRPYDGHSMMDVVGPVCESGDTFAREYPIVGQRGDLIAFTGVGAYGFAMSSHYNTRPRAAEVLIDNGTARLIRRRETLTELWAQEMDI
ncbi:MAG: diaminopimelate decarboxylase [Cardiobacteriaceae bacterium]|nr:diaminopimelate decarboxylase [Cardiobacteriaceae bacterium]